MKEERDHYQEKCEEQEKEIDGLKQKNLDLQLNLQKVKDEKQVLIDEYIKRMPDKENGGKES